MSQENVELVKRSHEAYRRGQFDEVIDTYLHPEIVWETRWPGLDHAFHGRDGVRDWLSQVMEPMEIQMELLDARALGDQVLASYRVYGAGKSSGIPTEMGVFDLLSFRDGLIVRRQTFYSEAEALEAAGSLE